MSTPKGYSSQEKEDRLSAQFQTVEPVRTMQFGSSVVSHEFVYEVGTDAAEAGSTASVIVATAHSALRGDVIRLTSGALSGREVKVWSVATNSITLAETLPSAVAVAVTFQILRHKYPTVDASGNVNVNAVIVEAAVAADGGALPALTKVVSGYDGAAVQVLKTDANGELQIDVLSSALPSGAATEAKQDSAIALLTTIDSDTSILAGAVSGTEMQVDVVSSALPSGAATETTLAAVKTAVEIIDNAISGNEMQVDVITSALPTGAATEATLATLATEATVSTLATEATLSALSAKVIEADTDNVTIVSSVLPTGAATEATLANVATSANQTNGSQKSQIVDGAGDIVDVVALNVALQATDKGLVTNTIIHGESTGGGGGYVDVKVSPSGAMVTETSISSIADVDGQQAMAASFPVVIASDQTAIPVTDNGSSLTVDGTVAVSAISAALPSGTNTIGKVDVNTLSVVETLFVDTASTTIFGSSGSLVQVVASTASAVKKMQILDTTGAFIGLYVGPAASEVLKVIIGPGSDQTVEHAIPASSRITVRRLDSTTNITTGILAINFIG